MDNQKNRVFIKKVDGVEYIDKEWVRTRINVLLTTIEDSQKRYMEAENLIMKMLNSPIMSFFYLKKYKEFVTKFRTHTLKF